MQTATRTMAITFPVADAGFLRKLARGMGWQLVALPRPKVVNKDETSYLLSSKEMTEIIQQGLEDANKGNYQIVNVDEI